MRTGIDPLFRSCRGAHPSSRKGLKKNLSNFRCRFIPNKGIKKKLYNFINIYKLMYYKEIDTYFKNLKVVSIW